MGVFEREDVLVQKVLVSEALLVAGRRVFARKGLAATRISDVAAEASVSQGFVYPDALLPAPETILRLLHAS